MAERRIRFPFEAPPAEGEVIEVADRILWVRLPLPMALDHVNIFALEDYDGWTLIDTGIGGRRSLSIWRALLDGPLKGRPVARVLLTQHHPDHVGLAGWFQAELGAEVLATRTAWLMARMLQLDEQPLPSGETLAHWRRAGMSSEMLAERAKQRPFNFADCVHPVPLGFTRLDEGQVLHLGGRDWTVRLGNGHAPDHATLWADGIVLGGDQFLPTISPNLGLYATEPEADPVGDWLTSCRAFQAFAKEDDLILPGHNLPFTGLPLRLGQLIDNHEGALDRLRAFLKTPHTATDCFQTIFKRSIGEGEYGLALVEAYAHVMHLWHNGEVSRTENAHGAYLWQMKA